MRNCDLTRLILLSLVLLSILGLNNIDCVFTYISSYFIRDAQLEYLFFIICLLGLVINYFETQLDYSLLLCVMYFFIALLLFSNNMLLSIIAIEGLSLTLISIVAKYTPGIKYYLLSSLASAFLYLGICLLYHDYGIVNWDWLLTIAIPSISTTFILAAICFKLFAAPFHNVGIELYTFIPTKLTTLYLVIPKLSYIVFIYRLLPIFEYNEILLIAISSLIVGSISALKQWRIKSLIAYASVTQLGFLLLAINTDAFMYYLIQYGITTFVLFGILNYKMTLKVNLLNFFFICCTLFSFAGIPPLLGFFAKLFIFKAILNYGYLYLSILLLLISVLTLVYYIKIMINTTIVDIQPFNKLDSYLLASMCLLLFNPYIIMMG